MKKITRFSVDYPVTVTMIVLGVLLLGWISLRKLGVDLFPKLNAPRLFVELQAGERPPEEMEKLFVENMESMAMRQRNVVEVSTICRVGVAQMTVEYTWDKDMDEAFLDLQKALTVLAQNSEVEDLTISPHDPNTSPILLVALSHETITDMNDVRKVAENYIRNELVRLEGVADVALTGEELSEVEIMVNPIQLEAYDLTLDDIASKIQTYNRNISGGRVVEMGRRFIVKGEGMVQEITDLESLIISMRQVPSAKDPDKKENVPVLLGEVAKIQLSNQEPVSIVRVDGERCVGLAIYKENQANTVKVVEDLAKAFDKIQKALPGYHFTMVQNQGQFIADAVSEVEETALMGGVLAIFILFFFLRRIGTTLIVSLAMPVSIVATFNLMYFNDLSLNVMTLGGLALGAGMLVDNAIVVMENIFRHHEGGKSARESAIQGTAQVGGAITASTLTTIVVFLPIVYMHGASGELFKDQAWTVAFSLLSSLVVAILLIPMLYKTFYGKKRPTVGRSVKFSGYSRILGRILDRRWLVITVALLLMGVTGLLVPHIGSEFMPKTAPREITLEVEMAQGTSLERTSRALGNLEVFLKELLGEDLEHVYAHAGPSGDAGSDDQSVFEDENTGFIHLILKEEARSGAPALIMLLEEQLQDMPEMEVRIRVDESALMSILGTAGEQLVVEVVGEDPTVIEALASQVKGIMDENTQLTGVTISTEGGAPELELDIDRYRAGLFNIGVDQVAAQVAQQLSGKEAGDFEKGGELIDINVKVPDPSLQDIQNLLIQGTGGQVRLNEIAEIKYGESPKEILRRNQSRIGKLGASLKEGVPLDRVVKELRQKLDQVNWPTGYKYLITGEEQKREESMANLSFALLLSIILVYMVLASQFESLLHPFTILLTIPLAVVGSLLLFFLMGKTLNIMAVIGVIMLVGIAVNDSIVLVDAINQFRRQGMTLREAVLAGGEQRIRPIIMTSLTTILALLPLTLGVGESASLRAPMALAVIGGLITSTLLTLVVIPCVYFVFDQMREKVVGRKV